MNWTAITAVIAIGYGIGVLAGWLLGQVFQIFGGTVNHVVEAVKAD